MKLAPWPDRFWARVDATGDCWEWTGHSMGKHGYGFIQLPSGRYRVAHRVTYELLVGPIPVGLELDHLCRNRRCVNPDHLEPVTSAENHRRVPTQRRTYVWNVSRGDDHYSRRRTHCPNGHEYPPVVPEQPRRCAECPKQIALAYNARRRLARAG